MSPATPSHKRRRLIIFIISVVLALFCWAYFAPSELDRYKAQLIAQGEILDLDQLAPKRTGHEPDGDAPLLAAQQQITNGFTLRSGKFEFEHTDKSIQRLQWHPNGNTNAPNWTNAITEVNSRQADFLLLHQLLQDPPKEKGGDYRDILHYRFADNGLHWEAAHLVHHAVILSAYAGDASFAFTNFITLLNLAQIHREEWSGYSQSMRIHVTRLALEDLNYCLRLNFWDEQQLKDVQNRTDSLSLTTNVMHSFLYNRALVSALFAMVRKNPETLLTNMFAKPMSSKDEFRITYWHRFDLANDEMDYLSLSQDRLNIFREQTRSPAWSRAFKPLQELHHRSLRTSETWWTDDKFTLATVFFNGFGTTELAYAETRRQQAITVLALERYRLKHSRYPDTLAQLIPDYLTKLPQDPMDGRPMRYRLNPDATFTLWSSGFDGKDNGGDPTVPSYQNRRFPEGALDLPWPRIDPADLPPKP